MKNVYSAYTKIVEGVNLYFVKRFTSFPELKDVPDFLEAFGMHKEFDEACRLAGITENSIKESLIAEIENNKPETKVIQMNSNSTLISKSGS